MNIKYLSSFLITLSLTLVLNVYEQNLVNASEGKVIQRIIEHPVTEQVGTMAAEKGVEYFLSLLPVQILAVLTVLIFIFIIWGIIASRG